MNVLLVTLSSISSAFSGMAFLALNMARHHRQLPKQHSFQSTRWRFLYLLIAILLLSISLASAISINSVGNGLVLWFGILTMTTFLLVILLAYKPNIVSLLGWTAMLIGLLAIAVTMLISNTSGYFFIQFSQLRT